MKRENHHLRHAVKGGMTRLRRPERASPPVTPENHDGMLRIESRELVPPALIEAGDESNEPLFGPIMWLVIILGSAFIALIAWLVSNMIL